MRPGRLFLQSLWVHRDYPEGNREFLHDRGRCRQSRKNNRREEKPAPDAGLIAAQSHESRKTSRKMGQSEAFVDFRGGGQLGNSAMQPTGSPRIVTRFWNVWE